jgi:serine/threonine protein kinase
MMDSNYAHIRDAYESIVQRPREEWRSTLDSLRQEVRDEVALLLEVREEAGAFLAAPIVAAPDLLSRIIDDFENREPVSYTGARLKDRYLIETLLGKGGFGDVYRGKDEHLHGRPVVVKVIKRSPEVEDWMAKHFRQEVEALTAIDHHGVVGILDAGETPDRRPFLVMQYVDGITLRTLIAHRPLTFERATRLLTQIGEALDAAHAKGILHRDLKPENILIREYAQSLERPVIIDFGIASIRQPEMREPDLTQIVGSRAYMAPEQLQGRPHKTSDIYALGMIAYEMVTGRKLADDRASSNIAALPGPAAEAIRRATLHLPADRFQSASAFTTAFSNAGRPLTRRKWAFAAVAAVVAGAAGAWTFLRPDAAFIEVSALKSMGDTASPLGVPASVQSLAKGDRFRLVLNSLGSYCVYVLSESGTANYRILFPDPGRESSQLTPSTALMIPDTQTEWLEFERTSARERLWVIASASAIASLEPIRELVRSGTDRIPDGALSNAIVSLIAPAGEMTVDRIDLSAGLAVHGITLKD